MKIVDQQNRNNDIFWNVIEIYKNLDNFLNNFTSKMENYAKFQWIFPINFQKCYYLRFLTKHLKVAH